MNEETNEEQPAELLPAELLDDDSYTPARALGCIAAQLDEKKGVRAVMELHRLLPSGAAAFPIELPDGRTFYVTLIDDQGQPVMGRP